MKFYPADWRADPALRTCSIAARGLWFEMLCLMWGADPRGSLLVNGRQITSKALAVLSGVHVKEVETLTNELDEAGVFSRDDDGTIFSRRMRRDVLKAARDKANGSGGGNPVLKIRDNRGVNPPDNRQLNESDNGKLKPPDNGEVKAHGTRTPATQKLEARKIPSQYRHCLDEGRIGSELGELGTSTDPGGVPATANGSALAWDDDAPFGEGLS